MRRGRGYSYRGSVVGCQWEVKGHRGNGERTVHLYRSGSHAGKTLRGKKRLQEGGGGGGGWRGGPRKSRASYGARQVTREKEGPHE